MLPLVAKIQKLNYKFVKNAPCAYSYNCNKVVLPKAGTAGAVASLRPRLEPALLLQLLTEAVEASPIADQHFAEVHHLLMGGGGLAAGPGAALAAARAAAAPASAPAPPLHPAPVHRDVDVRHREPKADHGAGSGCEDRAAAAALLAPFRTLPGTGGATLPNLPNAHGDRGTQS